MTHPPKEPARPVKKTDCLVIGWPDGETPEIISNGTDEDLNRGAKLYCEYSALRTLELENEKLKKENDSLNDLVGLEFHACKTGDCPHEKQSECESELFKLEKHHGFVPFTVTGNGFSKQFINPVKVIDFRVVQVVNQKLIDLESQVKRLELKLAKAVEQRDSYIDFNEDEVEERVDYLNAELNAIDGGVK